MPIIWLRNMPIYKFRWGRSERHAKFDYPIRFQFLRDTSRIRETPKVSGIKPKCVRIVTLSDLIFACVWFTRNRMLCNPNTIPTNERLFRIPRDPKTSPTPETFTGRTWRGVGRAWRECRATGIRCVSRNRASFPDDPVGSSRRLSFHPPFLISLSRAQFTRERDTRARERGAAR